MLRRLSYLGVLIVLVGSSFMMSGNAFGVTAAESALPSRSALPILAGTAATNPPSSLIMLNGYGFTPAGRVYIAFYDQWGVKLQETRWVTASSTVLGSDGSDSIYTGSSSGGTITEAFGASAAVYGANGSQDPANGYVAASLSGDLCGIETMVRAYDQQTARWSSLLDVDSSWLGCGVDQREDGRRPV